MTVSKLKFRRAPVEVDPTRMCELLVGLPDVVVLGVVDAGGVVPLRVYVEMRKLPPGLRVVWEPGQDQGTPGGGIGRPSGVRPPGPPGVAKAPPRLCRHGVEVRAAWHAKEVVRSIYEHHDAELAVAFVERLGKDLQDRTCPVEVQALGRTIVRWREQIAAWHRAHHSNGPTEAANNLIKRIKRVAFGLTSFRNHRIRVLLYAGRPNWELLATVTPR